MSATKKTASPSEPQEFADVPSAVSRLLTLCFDVAFSRETSSSSGVRAPIFRAALVHGADIRERLVQVYENHPSQAAVGELSRYGVVEPNERLRSLVGAAWERLATHVKTPDAFLAWYRLAAWLGDDAWSETLRSGLVDAVRRETPMRGDRLPQLAEAGVSQSTIDTLVDELTESLREASDLQVAGELERALREDSALIGPLLPRVDLARDPGRWIVALVESGRIERAQALLDASGSGLGTKISRAEQDAAQRSGAFLGALARLEGPTADVARQAQERRTLRLTSTEELDDKGVGWLFNVQNALTGYTDHLPPIRPAHILQHVDEVMQDGSKTAGDKVIVRGKAVDFLLQLGAYEEAAALAKVLRKKLGSTKIAKEVDCLAMAKVAGAAAALGRWDEALAWAEKYEQAAKKLGMLSVLRGAAEIARGVGEASAR